MFANSGLNDSSVFHNALSLVYHIKGDYDRAVQEVKFAVAEDPEVWQVLS